MCVCVCGVCVCVGVCKGGGVRFEPGNFFFRDTTLSFHLRFYKAFNTIYFDPDYIFRTKLGAGIKSFRPTSIKSTLP